jgi:hypothetical protein
MKQMKKEAISKFIAPLSVLRPVSEVMAVAPRRLRAGQ